MDNEIIFRKKYSVEIGDVDFKQEMKLSSIFNCFQDVSSSHVKELGFGINEIKQDDRLAWILVKIKTEIIKRPKFQEEITIETWPQNLKGIEYERDYQIKDSSGNVIINAESNWIVINIDTREIKKENLFDLDKNRIKNERAITTKFGNIRGFGNKQFASERIVRYSDIDLNAHLNNTKYFDYIMDIFPFAFHKSNSINGFQIRFANEALPDDKILLFIDDLNISSGEYYIEGIKESDKSIVFKALLNTVRNF